MENSTIVFYIISVILIFISTLQRSKDEELMDEKDTLLLPLITFFGFFFIYFLLLFVNVALINFIILASFSFFGYLTLVSNAYYLYEFAEYEIETQIYNEEISSSEFTEIIIHKHQTQEKQIVKKKNNGILHFITKKLKYYKKLIICMTAIDFVIYSLSFLLVLGFILTRNLILAEIITISFCFHGVREIKLDSLINGYTHLFILIFYDIISLIFYTQISEIMKNIEVPIKLTFPKRFAGYEMFGMGDIFIPALYIAVVKRFGEKNDLKPIYALTLFGLCLSVAIVFYVYRDSQTKNPGMIYICVIIGIVPAIYAVLNNKFKEYIFFKRKNQV